MHRRMILTILTLLVLSLSVLSPGTAAASHDVGPTRVYFTETGHFLSNGFLDYWRHKGALPVFGYPISEEFTDPNTGHTVQYFERAVFEWHPDAPVGWRVMLRRLGADFTIDRQNETPFKPIQASSDSSITFFPQTGHRLGFGFRAYWEKYGGLPIYGYPISEEFSENGHTVQYFERARFEWHPEHRGTFYEIQLGLLGHLAADRDGVDRSPQPNNSNAPVYNPGLWKVPAPASPRDVTTPPAGAPKNNAKWIEVDLSDQYLRAWEYDRLVFSGYVSTGAPRTPTPTGTFKIFSKIVSERMRGGTPGVDYYDVPDVPYTMYFASGGYAIHGAYWHNQFGTARSHGCVNLPVNSAKWMYEWAPIGTVVWIHQ